MSNPTETDRRAALAQAGRDFTTGRAWRALAEAANALALAALDQSTAAFQRASAAVEAAAPKPEADPEADIRRRAVEEAQHALRDAGRAEAASKRARRADTLKPIEPSAPFNAFARLIPTDRFN